MKAKLSILLIIILLLSSCNPAANKLRRAERLIKKAEALGGQWRVDTVFQDVPVFVDRIDLDTLLISSPKDTVIISKDRLRIKYVRLLGDTVWISGECDSLTIIKEVPVTITKVITAPQKGLKVWQWIVIALIFGLVLGMILNRK